MKEVHLSRQARLDLKSILFFFETEASTGIKTRFVRNFHKTCNLLSELPHLGRKLDSTRVDSNDELELYRFAVDRFPQYLIIYRVAPRAISITRILHGARHPALRLTDLS